MTKVLRGFIVVVMMILPRLIFGQLTEAPPLPPTVDAFIAEDTSASIQVKRITINGNKKTKEYIIRREMRFKENDSIKAAMIAQLIQQSRSLIYNTSLFTEVNIIPALDSGGISFDVTVREKWYLYPTPQFKLVDRNFNEWLKTYNADLDRVIYGVKFAHYNFSGRRDQLRIYLLTGYARNISFSYSAPYSNSALTEGFAVSAGFTQNREVPYKTSFGNGQVLFNTGKFVRESFSVTGAYIKRKGYYNSHLFSIGYGYLKVHDSVNIKSGYDYFNSQKKTAGFPELYYTFRHTDVDNINYPLKGNFYAASIFKRGLSFNGPTDVVEASLSGALFVPHGDNWYSNFNISGKVKAPFDLAYINRRAFGFGEFYLRGLEYYVIDGVAATLAQYTLRKKIIAFDIPVPFRIKVLPKIPFALYAKTFADAGVSYIPDKHQAMLNNRLLYTGGFGLDILTLYDINLKLEYSFNQLGQNGLFLHMRGGF